MIRSGSLALFLWVAVMATLGTVAASTEIPQADLVLVLCSSLLLVVARLRWRGERRRIRRTQRAAAVEREHTLALLRETLESTADGFLLLDERGKVVSYNRKVMEMSGLSAAAFADGSIEGLIGWMLERVEEPEAFIARLGELQATPHAEARDELRLLDGRIFERYTRPHRVGGRVEGRVWSFREITTERLALDALHRREQQLAEAQRIAHVGSWELDLRNNLLSLSDEMWRILGAQPREESWSLESCMEFVHPDDREAVLTQIRRAVETGGQYGLDLRLVRVDGSQRIAAVLGHAELDGDGRPVRLYGTAQDVTDRRSAAEALERANRVEAIGQLAAGIAHEINTPIQYVGDNLCFLDESITAVRQAIGAYEALLSESLAGPVAPERVEALARTVAAADLAYVLEEAPRASAQALDGVQRVAEIVRAMKEFSHPGSGMKVPSDLNQAIRSTATVARNEWKYVAELVLDLDEALPPVLCLPGELNQAILNLLVNAAHAISERQQAERHEEPGTIIVRTAQVGEWVEIRVTDTGTGIPAAIRGRIFDPFFTTKEVGRGTGQGLTFVHAIVVEKHGGTVAVETELGIGTTFTLRLPNAIAMEAAA